MGIVLPRVALASALIAGGVVAAGPQHSLWWSPTPELQVVVANDNLTPAGTLRSDTLRLDLVVQMGRWYPEAADGPFVDLAVLAEEGRAPQIPAPLIRVPTGTTVVATIRNTLPDSAIWVRGLAAHPAPADSVPIKPGESRTLTFAAGSPGTYLYKLTPGVMKIAATAPERVSEEDQLSGAFIVDQWMLDG